MNRSQIVRATAVALALVPLSAATASAARRAPQGPPPPPKATNGAKVSAIGQGVPTPTQFAFAKGTVFVAGAGAEDGSAPGGLYVAAKGRATRVKGSPRAVFGIVWSRGTLYLSSGPLIIAASGWNGKTFAGGYKTIYTAPRGFTGFNGLSIGPDGRIYSGVMLLQRDDHRRTDSPFSQSIVTLRTDGSDIRTFATGLRQPWMLTFAPGASTPLGTVLGQENLGRTQPPDYVIAPKAGDDYGFPACNWSEPDACAGFAKPISLLPAHSSPMGISVMGGKLYVALFGGTGRGPAVVSLPVTGGNKVKPVLTGFAAPVVALGTNAGYVYAGDLTGAVYRVKL